MVWSRMSDACGETALGDHRNKAFQNELNVAQFLNHKSQLPTSPISVLFYSTLFLEAQIQEGWVVGLKSRHYYCDTQIVWVLAVFSWYVTYPFVLPKQIRNKKNYRILYLNGPNGRSCT